MFSSSRNSVPSTRKFIGIITYFKYECKFSRVSKSILHGKEEAFRGMHCIIFII